MRAQVAGVNRRRELADRVVAFIDLDDIFCMAALVAWEQGRYRDAERLSEEGIARVAALGGESKGSPSFLAISRFLLGDWDAALAEYRRVIEREGAEPPGFLRPLCAVAEFVLSARRQTGELEMMRRIEMKAPMRLAFRALGLGAEGRAEEGLELILEYDSPAEGRSLAMMAHGQLLETLGRYPELSALCAEIRERAQRTDWAAGPAMADRLDAARLLAEGDPAGAAELARSSVERFAAIGAAWEAAVSQTSRSARGDAACPRSGRAGAAPGGRDRRARAVRRAVPGVAGPSAHRGAAPGRRAPARARAAVAPS